MDMIQAIARATSDQSNHPFLGGHWLEGPHYSNSKSHLGSQEPSPVVAHDPGVREWLCFFPLCPSSAVQPTPIKSPSSSSFRDSEQLLEPMGKEKIQVSRLQNVVRIWSGKDYFKWQVPQLHLTEPQKPRRGEFTLSTRLLCAQLIHFYTSAFTSCWHLLKVSGFIFHFAF